MDGHSAKNGLIYVTRKSLGLMNRNVKLFDGESLFITQVPDLGQFRDIEILGSLILKLWPSSSSSVAWEFVIRARFPGPTQSY